MEKVSNGAINECMGKQALSYIESRSRTFLEGNLATLRFRSVYLSFDPLQESYLKTYSSNFV